MANNLVQWAKVGTRAAYVALATKNANTMYFIQNTQEVYLGDVPFTDAFRIVDALPADPATNQNVATGVIYLVSSTLEGSIWNGTAWIKVITPVATSLTDGSTVTTSVSGEAIKTYVTTKFNTALNALSYDATTKAMSYVKGTDAAVKVPITGFLNGVTYNGSTGALTFGLQGGTDITVNIPVDNFVKSGAYDAVNHNIVLTLQDASTVTIPATDLVDVNEFTDTTSIKHTADGTGKISLDVKVSGAAGNGITVNADGIYASGSNVGTGHTDELIKADTTGAMASSGVKVGGSILAATPDANTVATEAAVNAIKEGLQTSIDGAAYVKTADVVAAVSADTPSTTKVTSEAAVVSALTWHTL